MSGRHASDEDEGIGPDVPDEPVPEDGGSVTPLSVNRGEFGLPSEDDPSVGHEPTEED